MRSSKSRSRNKNNRRPSGNIVNRVFDSSGPEGKVRGTPQQIIDKYTGLARDAQLSGDRVAVENFQQHAEHYTRMLGEALREQNERREAQEAQQNAAREAREAQNAAREAEKANAEKSGAEKSNADKSAEPEAGKRAGKPGKSRAETSEDEAAPVLDLQGGEGTGLVDTPEAKPARKPRAQRPRKPRAPKPAAESAAQPEAEPATAPAPDPIPTTEAGAD